MTDTSFTTTAIISSLRAVYFVLLIDKATGWTTGVRLPAPPPHPDRLWGPHRLLSSGFRDYFHGSWSWQHTSI